MNKVTSLANYPEDYNKPENYYWRPLTLRGINQRERGWIGRFITVTCWQLAWQPAGKDEHGDPTWCPSWFGYVQEINKYVPARELH